MHQGIQALLILFALQRPTATAQTAEEPFAENFRERCRKYVSGSYAESWNEANRARDAQVLAEKALQKLSPRQDLANKQLATLQKQLQSEDYEPSLIQKRDELIAQIKLLHEQIQDQEAILAQAKKSAKASNSSYKSLNNEVSKIFHVSFVEDPEGLPRKLFHQLTWKTPCPKYRTLCPLPPSQVKTLKSIAKTVGDEEQGGNCLKYSNIK